MTRAFVLSGGTSFGAVQVGMAQALAAEGITPEVVVGTSVGALNGAWLAGGRPLGELESLWRGLRRSEIFPLDPVAGFLGFFGRRDHLVSNRRLRALLERHVTFDDIADAPIPFAAMATDLASGRRVLLDSGSVVEAILASSALPGVFPAVTIGDRVLVDGGVVDNTPISAARAMGATEIWVLTAGWGCELTAPPRTPLGVAVQSLMLLVRQRLAVELSSSALRGDRSVYVVPSPCPIDVSPLDFSHSEELIERGRRRTAEWLAAGRPLGDRSGPRGEILRLSREPGVSAPTS